MQELAKQFDQTADEFVSFVATLTPEEWSLRGKNSPIWSLGADEERTVVVIAYHAVRRRIHNGMRREALVGRRKLGDGRWEMEGVAAWNASVAQDKVGVKPYRCLERAAHRCRRDAELARKS